MSDPTRIVFAYRARTAQIRTQLERYVTDRWNRLPDYRAPNIDAFAGQVAPVVTGAQRQMGALTDAYLAAYETAVTGTPTRPIGIAPADTTDLALRGVDALEVYQRGGPTVWTALSDGDTLTEAVTKGLVRMVGTAGTDLQLAKTHASQQILESKGNVTGYRRVLEGGHSCGLCIVASTQRYHRGDLMPIHGGCDCGIAPIYGEHDPGQIIDPDTLEGVHQAIFDRFGVRDAGARDPIDYRDALIVHEHGELGPVLAVRGQTFTGPSDLDV